MKLLLLCIGAKADPIFTDAATEYEQRIKQLGKQFELVKLEHSTMPPTEASNDESSRLLKKILPQDVVVLFDEHGKNYTSPELASMIEQTQNSSQRLVCIIGGAYGVNDEVKTRANKLLSFGTAVFPHQLVRVMVLEQLYRALSILGGSKYHHG